VIVLDTNVLSAVMRAEPDVSVRSWLDQQRVDDVCTTAITILEIRAGIEMLPVGRRRRELDRGFTAMLSELTDRVLPFDTAAALASASLVARRRKHGRSIEYRDTQIAGIALVHRAKIATFNTRHFADLEVDLVEPRV